MRLFTVSSCVALAGVVACGEIAGITDLDSQEKPDGAPSSPIDAGRDTGADVTAAAADTGSDAGADVDAGPSFRRVFVTSGGFLTDGAIGGLAKADEKCTNAAQSRGLNAGGEKWIAWMSGNGMDAIARVQWDGPYQLLDGTPVVANKTQLASGALLHPIDRNENDEAANGNADQQRVWTGTSPFGKLTADTCANWTDSISTLGTYGRLSAKDGAWTNEKSTSCFPSMRLYCFEQ